MMPRRSCDCGADHRRGRPDQRPHDPHCGTVTYVTFPEVGKDGGRVVTAEATHERLRELRTHMREKNCHAEGCVSELLTLLDDLDAVFAPDPPASDVDASGMTREAAWARYRTNHPEVLASWGEQNGRWPNCACKPCDPEQLIPRPNILPASEPGSGQ